MKTPFQRLRPLAAALFFAAPLLIAAVALPRPALAQTMEGTMAVRNVSVFSISSTSILFGELVTFSGTAVIKSRMATDAVGEPSMLYQVDLSGVTARGLLSLRSYKVVSEETVMRPPTASTSFSYMFPFDSNGTFGLSLPSTRFGTATFALNVNTTTGAVTSASVGMQAR